MRGFLNCPFSLCWSRFADELRHYCAEGEQGHQRNDAQGNHAVDAPYAEDIFFDVREVEREGESGEGGNEQQAVGAQEGERAHEKVAGDAEDGDGDSGHHGVGAMVDDATVPAIVNAAGRIALGAVVFAQGKRRNGDAE